MNGKLVFHHIGSRNIGVGLPITRSFSGDMIAVLYDADEDSVSQTKSLWQSSFPACDTRVYPYCLAAHTGTATFYITFDAYASSLLPINPEMGAYYTYIGNEYNCDYQLSDAARCMIERQVETVSLDTLISQRSVPAPDFLSLDTQGSEYEILSGAQNTLRTHVLAVASEGEFSSIYQGQKRLVDLQPLLESQGFHLVDIAPHDGLSPYRAPIGARARGTITAADVVFFRHIDSILEMGENDDTRFLLLHKFALIAILFKHLEEGLLALEKAAHLSPSAETEALILSHRYGRFCRDLRAAVCQLPQTFPPLLTEVMDFAGAQSRFKTHSGGN